MRRLDLLAGEFVSWKITGEGWWTAYPKTKTPDRPTDYDKQRNGLDEMFSSRAVYKYVSRVNREH